MDYIKTHPKVAKELEENKKPFGLCNTEFFRIAEKEGYKFEKFSHLNIIHDPVWVEDNALIEKWKFTDTYRMKY